MRGLVLSPTRGQYGQLATDLGTEGDDLKPKIQQATMRRRVVLGMTCVVVLVLWLTQRTTRAQTNDRDAAPSSTDRLRQCDASVLRPLRPPLDNVWQPLTVSEAAHIRHWLLDPARNLNLTRADIANLTDNTIDMLELLPPPKQSALAWLNGTNPKPERYARVVLHFGGRVEPVVEVYKVGPLPLSPVSTLAYLRDIYHRPIIPYNARGVNIADMIAAPTMYGIEEIVEKIFGGQLRGLENDTLGMTGSAPLSLDGSFRRSWSQYRRYLPGGWLHALPLWVYLDESGTDPSLWGIRKIVYHHQAFSSADEFKRAYHNGTLKIAKDDYQRHVDSGWSSRKRRGASRDLDDRAGPRPVSFAGPRFRVDVEQAFVSWMGWQMYLGFNRDMGLSLWDIRFLNERIIYELSPQEALAQYAGNDPRMSTTAWLDGYFGMGALVHELIPNYDCPHGAVFLPATTHAATGSMTNPRAICIFEVDSGKAMTRHRGYARSETGLVKDFVLVVRSVTSVGNYDYTFDYTFMLDGTLEVRVSASGYLQGSVFDPKNSKYGTRIHQLAMGGVHDHVVNFKVDFDLVNEHNSLLEKTTHVEEVELDWLDDDWGRTSTQQYIKDRIIKTEDDSRLRYAENLQGVVAIVNQDKKNSWGVPRGYSIIPGMSPIHQTAIGAKRVQKNVGWAKDNIAVTKRKETEPRSSAMWNQNLPGAPTVEFDRFFDGESIEQEDIVAWVNIGMHHLTQAEDVPNTRMNTASSSFTLSPLNFFDYDVSMSSKNAILVDFDAVSGDWITDENGISEPVCIPSSPKPVDYGNDIAFDIDGRVVLQTGADWLRANLWPYLNRVYA